MSADDFRVFFVCTGNLFRSPLAAELFRAELAGLPVVVSSAGTLNLGAVPAEPEAVEQAALLGADLSSHRARGCRPGPPRHGSRRRVRARSRHRRSVEGQCSVGAVLHADRALELLEREPEHDAPDPGERARSAVEASDALRTLSGTPRASSRFPIHSADRLTSPNAWPARSRPSRADSRSVSSGLGSIPEGREEDHVPDRLAACEHHGQTVDAQAEAACRRHPIGQSLDVVGITCRTAGGLWLKRPACSSASLISV